MVHVQKSHNSLLKVNISVTTTFSHCSNITYTTNCLQGEPHFQRVLYLRQLPPEMSGRHLWQLLWPRTHLTV